MQRQDRPKFVSSFTLLVQRPMSKDPLVALFSDFDFGLWTLDYSFTQSHDSGSPRTMGRAARLPKTCGSSFGDRPCPGRIERTFCSVNSSPAAISATANSERRKTRLFV